MTPREIAHALRSIVMRGVVRASSDTGESQTAKVTIADGIDRTDVEVMQPFGIASHAPAGGAAVLLAVGGDTSDLVLIPVSSPGMRLGGLREGEAAIYSVRGNRVHAKADGSIEILGSTRIVARVESAQIEITPEHIRATVDDAEIEITADMIRALVGGSRVVAKAGYAKLKSGGNHVAVTPDAITSSVAIVIGADPDPSS